MSGRWLPFSFVEAPPPLPPDPIGAWIAEHQDQLDYLQRNRQWAIAAGVVDHTPIPPRHSHHASVPADGVFRHSGWRHFRFRVHQALERMGPLSGRLKRFSNCGAHHRVEVRADEQDLRIVCDKCEDRFCVPCQQKVALAISTNVASLCEGQTILFVTLTMRHSQTPLIDQLNRLLRSFAMLRRRGVWTQAVKGGGAFLEIKVSSRDGLWHPHLHCLVVGKWLDNKLLSQAWHEITGDSSITDVRRPKTPEEIQGYVTKYVTKPVHSSIYDDLDRLTEAMLALRGRHRCMSFGCWRGTPLEALPDDGHVWVPLCSVFELVRDARNNDRWSLSLYEAFCRKYQRFGLAFPLTGCPPSLELGL